MAQERHGIIDENYSFSIYGGEDPINSGAENDSEFGEDYRTVLEEEAVLEKEQAEEEQPASLDEDIKRMDAEIKSAEAEARGETYYNPFERRNELKKLLAEKESALGIANADFEKGSSELEKLGLKYVNDITNGKEVSKERLDRLYAKANDVAEQKEIIRELEKDINATSKELTKTSRQCNEMVREYFRDKVDDAKKSVAGLFSLTSKSLVSTFTQGLRKIHGVFQDTFDKAKEGAKDYAKNVESSVKSVKNGYEEALLTVGSRARDVYIDTLVKMKDTIVKAKNLYIQMQENAKLIPEIAENAKEAAQETVRENKDIKKISSLEKAIKDAMSKAEKAAEKAGVIKPGKVDKAALTMRSFLDLGRENVKTLTKMVDEVLDKIDNRKMDGAFISEKRVKYLRELKEYLAGDTVKKELSSDFLGKDSFENMKKIASEMPTSMDGDVR